MSTFKKVNWKFPLLTGLLGCLLTLGSCGDDEPNDPGQGQEPDPIVPTTTFTVDVKDITATSAGITVTPSDAETTYFASVVPASSIAEMDDDAIVEAMVASEDFSLNLHRDVYTFTADNLTSETSYSAIVFEYVKGKAGALTKTAFVTGKPTTTSRNIVLSNINVGHIDASMRVQPDLLTTPWFYVTMEKSYYDKYVSQEGDPEGPMLHSYYVLQNTAVDMSMNIGQYLSLVSMYGTKDITIKDLRPSTDYVVLVFYVDPSETNPTNIFDYYYAKAEFTTKVPEQGKEATVNIVNSNASTSNGVVTISVTAKATNAASGSFKLAFLENYPPEVFDLNDPQSAYTIATLMGKTLSSAQIDALNSAEGYTFVWQMNESDIAGEFVFGVYVQNEEGAGEAKAIAIDPFQ